MVGHITSFRVIFENNPRGIFFDGQTLSGIVRIYHRRQKRVNRIILTVTGRGRIRDTINETHRDYNFLRQEVVLANFMSGHLLTPGDYKYNFTYKLKEKLCPTFYGRKGFVHYELVITLIDDNGREGRPAVQYKHPFTVLRSMSLTKYRHYHKLKPVVQTKIIEVCYYCCTISQPFDVTIQFPFRAFCPGDWLFIRLLCRSDVSEQLNLIKMKLLQNIKYTHMNGIETVSEQVKIAKVKTEYSANLKGKDFVVGMKIPLVHPTNENSYPDLVTITYRMEVEVDLLTCCDDRARFDFNVPIHVENLDNFNYDYCTHKKKKKVVTTQPLRSVHWQDQAASQTRMYPSIGWNPQSYTPMYPVGTVLTEIGLDTKNPIENSSYPYSSHTIPSVTSKDIPSPLYPTYQFTSMHSDPIWSINAITSEVFPPAKRGPTLVPPSKTAQVSPKNKRASPISSAPSLSSAFATLDPETLPNGKSSLVKPTESSVTLPSILVSDSADTISTTLSSPYTPVYDQHSTLASPYPKEITYSPKSTKQCSPIPVRNPTATEQKESNATPPTSLSENRIISDAIISSHDQPVKPPSEILNANSSLISVNSSLPSDNLSFESLDKPATESLDKPATESLDNPAVESLDKLDSTQLDDSSAYQNKTEQLGEEQGLNKGRKKILGERKKKFQS